MKNPVEIKKRKNLVLPNGKPLSIEELTFELNKAENGNFITVQEGMLDFEQWLQSSFIPLGIGTEHQNKKL